MYDLVIIHSQDTTTWTEYILGYLDKESFNKKICILRDIELVSLLDDVATRSEIHTARAIIVIASPVHLQFLIEWPTFSYFGLITDIQKAQIFLCGSEMVDFDARDLEGFPIFQRFPDFFNWKKLTHDKHAELLTNAMILMEPEEKPTSPVTPRFKGNGSNGGKRRRKREFEGTPIKVKCEEPTIITLLFAESIADSADQFAMGIVFLEKNVVDSVPISIEAKWRNPYTCQFRAPDFPAGTTKFTVVLNGTEIGTKTLTYYSGEECLTQIYIHQMARLCRYIRDVGLLTSEVDSLLSEILDESLALPIPVQAFENIFGSLCFANEGQSQYEFPTLLHLAAKFGFHEFATKLIDLPVARQAYNIRNLDGLLPEVIAKNCGHLELARLFQDFHVVNETISSVYEIYFPEQRQSYRLSDASEYSVTPTAVLSSSGSEDTYMDMQGKSPHRVEEKDESEESENDEGGYVDMEEPELSKTIAKQKQAEEPKLHAKLSENIGEHEKGQHSEEQQDAQSPAAASTTAEQTNPTDDVTRLESLTLEDVPNVADVPESQKELIGILTTVIQGKISVAEGEYLIKGWNFRHNHGRSRSFKEKQVQLSKMRDQVTKAKDKIKEPSWWNSIITVLKKHPSNASSNQPAVTSGAESLGASGLSTSKSFRQLASQENLAIGAKTRKFYKVPAMTDPQTSENAPSLLEPISENPQRNSNASASSRESLLSVTSRTSTSSGVDIDTVDEEHVSEMESRVRNPQQGNLDYGGVKYAALCKRKSRNLEILEEELTCSDAPSPPPLPPRTGPRAESFRGQVGKNDPTSPKPGQPIKIASVALPPMPHQARSRSSSEGCIIPMHPVSPSLVSGKPPWKSVDQPPPISPRLSKKNAFKSTQRRPAPTLPSTIPENWSDPVMHAVGNPQYEAKSSLDNRPYIQYPVPSAGKAYAIRSRSREGKTKQPSSKKGALLKQAIVTDPEVGVAETTENIVVYSSFSSEGCDKLCSLEFKGSARYNEDLPAYRVLRALPSPELTDIDHYKDNVCWPHFHAESIETIDTFERQATKEKHQQIGQHQLHEQQKLQREDESHFYHLMQEQEDHLHQKKYTSQQKQASFVEVKIPSIDIATETSGQNIEAVSSVKYIAIEKPRFQDEPTATIDASEKQTTEEYQEQQLPQQRHQQEANYDVSRIPAICITAMAGEEEREEVLNEKCANVEQLPDGSEMQRSDSSSNVDDVLFSSSELETSIVHGCLRKSGKTQKTSRPPPVCQAQESVYRTNQEHSTVLPIKANVSMILDVEYLPCIEPESCTPLLQATDRTPNSPIGTNTPTNSETPINTDATVLTTIGSYEPAIVQSSVVDSHCRYREAETSIDELKNFLSELENAPRASQSESTSPVSLHFKKAGSLIDVLQVSSSMSPTLTIREAQRPGQVNVSNPGEIDISKLTEVVDSVQEPNVDTEDIKKTKKDLSSSLKKSEKSSSGLERIQRRSEKRPVAICPQLSTEETISPKATTIEKQVTECGTAYVGEPAAEIQSPKEGTSELSVAQSKRPLPAKPPKAKRLDSSSNASALEEPPQNLRPTSETMQTEVRSNVMSPSPQLGKSPSPVTGRREKAATASGDHESSVRPAPPPRVPSKPLKGPRK